jgi:zinc D-Ala-D-Ala carboxypeptidase
MQLSEHFSYEEVIFSSTAQRLGIDNTPAPNIIARLIASCQQLEDVRALLPAGCFLHVDSGYRCPALNQAVGGVPTSDHVAGYAFDVVPRGEGAPGNLALARQIAGSGIRFAQLILEYGWVHVSFNPTYQHEVMTKLSASSPYISGLIS